MLKGLWYILIGIISFVVLSLLFQLEIFGFILASLVLSTIAAIIIFLGCPLLVIIGIVLLFKRSKKKKEVKKKKIKKTKKKKK